MWRSLLVVTGFAACERGGKEGPRLHRNVDPAFELEVPAGFRARPTSDDPPGGRRQSFIGPGTHYLHLEWGPRDGRDAVASRDEAGRIKEQATSERIVGTGELPDGGAWLETDHDDGLVLAWLVVGDAMVVCTAGGPALVLAGCKSLRPAGARSR